MDENVLTAAGRPSKQGGWVGKADADFFREMFASGKSDAVLKAKVSWDNIILVIISHFVCQTGYGVSIQKFWMKNSLLKQFKHRL